MTPPGFTTDPAVLAAEERYTAALAEEERLRHLHTTAIYACSDALVALRAAKAAAWANADVSYEDAKAWLQAHPDVPLEQTPMGVFRAALSAHRGTP